MQPIDPTSPRTARNFAPHVLSGTAWAYLIASVGASYFLWDSYGRNREIPLGTLRVAWQQVSPALLGIVLVGILLQGAIVFALLQGFASIVRDVRGIRLSAKAAAVSLSPAVPSASAPRPEAPAPEAEAFVRCEECGREVPQSEIVRFLGRNVCQEDYQRWLTAR